MIDPDDERDDADGGLIVIMALALLIVLLAFTVASFL